MTVARLVRASASRFSCCARPCWLSGLITHTSAMCVTAACTRPGTPSSTRGERLSSFSIQSSLRDGPSCHVLPYAPCSHCSVLACPDCGFASRGSVLWCSTSETLLSIRRTTCSRCSGTLGPVQVLVAWLQVPVNRAVDFNVGLWPSPCACAVVLWFAKNETRLLKKTKPAG